MVFGWVTGQVAEGWVRIGFCKVKLLFILGIGNLQPLSDTSDTSKKYLFNYRKAVHMVQPHGPEGMQNVPNESC